MLWRIFDNFDALNFFVIFDWEFWKLFPISGSNARSQDLQTTFWEQASQKSLAGRAQRYLDTIRLFASSQNRPKCFTFILLQFHHPWSSYHSAGIFEFNPSTLFSFPSEKKPLLLFRTTSDQKIQNWFSTNYKIHPFNYVARLIYECHTKLLSNGVKSRLEIGRMQSADKFKFTDDWLHSIHPAQSKWSAKKNRPLRNGDAPPFLAL